MMKMKKVFSCFSWYVFNLNSKLIILIERNFHFLDIV